ncbi:MAG: nucleoside deaminase [Clostridiales bacterium]|nr:nucleoside deaminase [Clostridiales bacterium]
MWADLSNQWKRSFELAFESYKRGTIPIGAVITDSEGEIISEGRNRIFDNRSANPLAGTFMAHAEMTAMIQLKSYKHPDIRTYTLYTTMEPCPMCFGTMVMMNIRNLKYAARDAFAGATELNNKMDYIRNKNISIEKGNSEMEAFHLIMQTSYECDRNHIRVGELLNSWKSIDGNAIVLGKKLYKEKYFDRVIAKDGKVCDIYDEIIYRYEQMM